MKNNKKLPRLKSLRLYRNQNLFFSRFHEISVNSLERFGLFIIQLQHVSLDRYAVWIFLEPRAKDVYPSSCCHFDSIFVRYIYIYTIPREKRASIEMLIDRNVEIKQDLRISTWQPRTRLEPTSKNFWIVFTGKSSWIE